MVMMMMIPLARFVAFVAVGRSYFMLLASSFLLNHLHEPAQYTLHPWLHSACNHACDADQLRGVGVPDVPPPQLVEAEGLLSMCAGDFVVGGWGVAGVGGGGGGGGGTVREVGGFLGFGIWGFVGVWGVCAPETLWWVAEVGGAGMGGGGWARAKGGGGAGKGGEARFPGVVGWWRGGGRGGGEAADCQWRHRSLWGARAASARAGGVVPGRAGLRCAGASVVGHDMVGGAI